MSAPSPLSAPRPRGPLLGVGGLAVVGVVLLLTLPALAAGAPSPPAVSAPPLRAPGAVHPNWAPAPGAAAAPSRAPASLGTSALAPQPAGPLASGPGTFFTTASMPLPPTANESCYRFTIGSSTCSTVSDSNGPVLNRTSNGVLAVAYTVYAQNTPCGGIHVRYTDTLVAVATSRDGSTWSRPRDLGATACDATNASYYPSSWQPAITSLANGTIVLAYVAYNLSASWAPYAWAEHTCSSTPTSCANATNVKTSELLVTESYDNGSTWSTPTVVNRSVELLTNREVWLPWRPSITAVGNTIYLAWENFTGYWYTAYLGGSTRAGGSSGVNLVVSPDGGASWSNATRMPVEGAGISRVAMNPSLLVLPNGTLAVAYATNLTYGYTLCCGNAYSYYSYHIDVVVATTANNGTNVSLTTVASAVPVDSFGAHSYWDYQLDPSPALAYGAGADQLYVTFSANAPRHYCYSYSFGGGYCYYTLLSEVYFANLSLASPGATWSPQIVGPLAAFGNDLALNGSYLTYSARYLPSLAVGPNGTVLLEAMGFNGSACTVWVYGTLCGLSEELYLTSGTNGSSWSAPVVVSWNETYYSSYMPNGPGSAVLASGGHVYLAWTSTTCPQWNGSYYSYCSYSSFPMYGRSVVQVSTLFNGSGGLTLTFKEHGLHVGTGWTVNVLGNTRTGNGATLSVSGVPPKLLTDWAITVSSPGYGVRYFGKPSALAPRSFSANATIYDNFTVQYLVNITSNPYYPQSTISYYCPYGVVAWDTYYCPTMNYNLTPGVGPTWMKLNSTLTLSVSPAAFYCMQYYGCDYYSVNLTFLSWTGTGVGSTNTSAFNTTLTVGGPINESANFLFDGWCYWYSYPSNGVDCLNSNASVTFFEHGLPNGTTWGVSTWGTEPDALTPVANFTAAPFLTLASDATIGPTYYVPWEVRVGSTTYSATGSPASPVEVPYGSTVDLNYTASAGSSGITVVAEESGLAAGTPWSFGLGNASYGIAGPVGEFTGSVAEWSVENASAVYFANGTGYRPVGIDLEPFLAGVGWENRTTLPERVYLNTSALVEVPFAPTDELSTYASTGGSVNLPATGWYLSGSRVELQATPLPGYHFVGWTGNGTGSVTGSSAFINVTMGAPVSELATFGHDAPPHFTVVVQPRGLPPGEAFTVEFNGSRYAGVGNLTLPAVLPGVYAFGVPYSYANASELTRFVPISVTTSLPLSSPGEYLIGQSGTINVTFATQYLLSLATSGPGSISPAPGVSWQPAAAGVTVLATPSFHYMLSMWTGTGTGSVSGAALGITVRMESPVTETAYFVWRAAAPPATYTLTVSEQGLPGGYVWHVAAGEFGAAGPTSTLVISGLNGTYAVSASVVEPAAGVRWQPTANSTVPVTSNGTWNVTYREWFYATITTGSGGTSSPASGWYPAGSTIALSAAPANSSYGFSGWAGDLYTGAGASSSVVLTGPLNETATFDRLYPTTTTGSTTAGMSTSLLLLALLAAVGVGAGALLARRRGGGGASGAAEEYPPDGTEASYADDGSASAGYDDPSAAGELAPEPYDAPAAYDEGPPAP